MGYIPKDDLLKEIPEIREYVTPYHSNGYIMQLINAYAAKYPGKVVRPEAKSTNDYNDETI